MRTHAVLVQHVEDRHVLAVLVVLVAVLGEPGVVVEGARGLLLVSREGRRRRL